MPDITETLRARMEEDPAMRAMLDGALQEILELRKKRDALEEILIILARTELPWDVDDRLNDAFPLFKARYLNAMHEASQLLGLELRSTITRTEPRT